MKKNISINISGIIFHIEEDGYEALRSYLDSINKYFSTFDDTGEIVADIESRIAEIFLSKLNEGKQVITKEDVDSLIATMGSIQDFQAVEEKDQVIESAPSGDEKAKEESQPREEQVSEGPRKLYRDGNRRLLGGVSSGIAHYFSIDPLWIRLLIIILASDIFFSHSLGFVVVVGYIVLWIILPVSFDLQDDKSLKKMYRNPEDRVLGGIAGGFAAYFGADVTVIRLLFVLSIFLGGTGLIVYIILWIILPEAKSITDKVQMKGEPVTLENIESNIKKSLNVEGQEEESTLVKVLLFPFRLLATIIKGLGKALGPILLFLVDAIRIVFGLILVLIGVSMIFSLIVSLGVVLGLVTGGGGYLAWWDFPYDLISEAIPAWAVVLAFVSAFIPTLAITLLGLSVIAKAKVINTTVGWSMFGIWILTVIGLSFVIPRIVFDFRTEGEYEETQSYTILAQSVHLDLNETGMDDYDFTHLSIRGHDDNQFKLVKEYRAQGSSRREAVENAQMVEHRVSVRDSIITFDSNIRFRDGAKFRFQELDMTLYIPFGQDFTMSDDLRHILRYYSLSRHGYNLYQMEDNTWRFNPSGLECTTCFDENQAARQRSERFRESYDEFFQVRGYYDEFDFRDFEDLDIQGAFEIHIMETDDYRIIVNGPKEQAQRVTLKQDGTLLRIDSEDEFVNIRRASSRVKIIMGIPELSKLEVGGASKVFVKGFERDQMTVELNGASEGDLDVDVNRMTVELGGASKLTLAGTGHELDADLSAASALDAYDFRVDDARIKASVASSAKVYVEDNLDIDASIASDIKYRGGARVTSNRFRD